MAKRRITSLLICIIMLFATPFSVSASDANINTDHTYRGFGGYEGLDYAALGVSENVPVPLLTFVKADHNSYTYTLDTLKVIDLDGNPFPYSRAEVLGGASYAFPNSDYRVEIEYDTDVIITATAGPGGRIDNDEEYGVEVPYGGDITFTLAPNYGYRISDIKVDGVSVGATANYTFTGVDANHAIHAEFAAVSTGGGTSGSDDSSTAFTLKYYKNIVGDESEFHMQSGFYRGDAVTVTGKVPTREGYRFLYWTANSTGWGERYLSGDRLQIFRDTNLYANWEEEAALPPDTMPDTSPDNVNSNPGTGAPSGYPAIVLFAVGCIAAAAVIKKRNNNLKGSD